MRRVAATLAVILALTGAAQAQRIEALVRDEITLESRASIAAADAAPVNGTTYKWPWNNAWIHVKVSIDTAGTTRDARVAIEGSADGSTWHQLVRITDVTGATTVNRIIRLGGAAASTVDAAAAASDLTGASGAATVNGPLPRYLRAVTQLQATNGCTVSFTVKAVGTL